MPKIVPERCVELLYEIQSLNIQCWELSKNMDLTKTLEEQRDLITRMIKTIEDAFVSR